MYPNCTEFGTKREIYKGIPAFRRAIGQLYVECLSIPRFFWAVNNGTGRLRAAPLIRFGQTRA